MQFVLFPVLCFIWLVKKHSVVKILPAVWETLFYEKIVSNSYKFVFIPFLFFRRTQKQEPNFQHVGGLLGRNISVLCL